MDTTPVDEKRGSAGLNTRLSCAISLFVYCLSFLLFNSLELSACCKCQGRLKVHGHVCCSSQAATERQNNHRHERANERNRVTSKLEDNGPIGDISRCNGHAHDRQADCDQRDEQEPDDDSERV
jgi:hypothetical protein